MENNKRIAICLYGQPRLIESGYVNISKFIQATSNYYNIDILIHTWWSKSMIGQKYSHSPWRYIADDEIMIKEDDIDKIQKLYNPKKILVDEPKYFDEYINTIKELDIYKNSNEHKQKNINNTLSNLYSKYKVAELLTTYCNETKYTYEGIVSMRFDILNSIPFDFRTSEINKIYTKSSDSRFFLTDSILIFTDINLFLNYSKAYTNIKLIDKAPICKEATNILGINVELNIEEICILNLLLYYSINEVINCVVFSNSIPNFM